MLKKYFLILILFIGISIQLFGQNTSTIDSLIRECNELFEDSTKVKLYMNISSLYSLSNIESSLIYANKAEKLAKKINDKKRFVNSLLLQTRLYAQQGKIDSSLSKIKLALSLFRNNDDYSLLYAKINMYAGNVYSELNDFNKSTFHFLEALAYFEAHNEHNIVARILNNLGNIYLALNDEEKAIKYLEKAKIKIGINARPYSTIIYNLGTAYKNTGNYTKALTYYNDALQMEIIKKDSLNIAKTYNGIGLVYKNIFEYNKALENLNLALIIKEKLENPKYIASTLNSIASIKIMTKNYNDAIELALRSYKLANSVHAKNEKFYSLENLYKAHENLNQFEDALYYYKLYYNSRDSMFYTNEKSKNLIIDYEVKAKDNEIKLHIAQNKNKTYIIILLIMIISMITIIIIFLNRNQKNKHRQKLIEERTLEAENQKRRFAKELHDGVGSNLTGIRLQLAAIQEKFNPTVISNIIAEVDRTHQGIRLLSYQTIPPEFDNYTLDQSLNDLASRLSKTGTLQINYSSIINFKWSQTSKEIQLTIYRIIQESLSNVIKHSEATNVDIQIIQHQNELNLMIEDNGKGMDISIEPKGIGLNNIKERVKYLKGSLAIDSSANNGTSIIIYLPLSINKI